MPPPRSRDCPLLNGAVPEIIQMFQQVKEQKKEWKEASYQPDSPRSGLPVPHRAEQYQPDSLRPGHQNKQKEGPHVCPDQQEAKRRASWDSNP